jgi:2-polyprenyl-3-methyl-5-hydroxy-6-metoxy-1,4-benzoquinol methylase
MMTPPAVSTSCRACDRAPIARPGRRALEGFTLMHCPGCGLEWLDPQPDDATLGRIYRQEYYDAWGVQDDAEATRTLKRSMFRRLLAPVARRHGPGARLLDCGAALGYLMEEAAAAGLEPYGVELSEFGANAIAERFGPDRIFQGPFEQAEFARVDRDFFDIITMFDFLEHVRDPGAVLAKAFRLLRTGGSLVILTPDAASLSSRVMGPRWLHYKVEHLSYFTPKSLRHYLAREGFRDVRVGRAIKTMNLHYVSHQLSKYPHPVLTPLITLAHRLSPPPLRKTMFPITFGEQLAIATKPGSGGDTP